MFELPVRAEMASIKARTLTGRLLPFANGRAPVKKTAAIEDIIEESSSFASRGSTSGRSPSTVKHPCGAEIDVGRITQIINNIILNAAQSMPEGDIIRIAAENQKIEEHSLLGLKPGKYIRISITDHGVGKTEENPAKILNPYFAIKQKTTGTVRNAYYPTIKNYDEHVSIEFQSSGTDRTMTVYLPSSVKILNKEEEIKLIKCHGRILVMDNEVSLRKTAMRVLKEMRYESEGAIDSANAIQKYKKAEESGQTYDDVILDLTI